VDPISHYICKPVSGGPLTVYPCLRAIAHFLQKKVAPLRCIFGSRKVVEVARIAASRVGVCGAVQRKYRGSWRSAAAPSARAARAPPNVSKR
jgi:hypothetical protein